jgi:hypothetical protein
MPSKWSTLRKIAQLRIFSYIVLIPSVGYFLVFNSKFMDFIRVSAVANSDEHKNVDVVIALLQNTQYKLYCFYFGFTLLSIGYVIYQIHCPSIINIYGRAVDFIKSEETFQTSISIDDMKAQVRRLNVSWSYDFGDIDEKIERLNSDIVDNEKNIDIKNVREAISILNEERARNIRILMNTAFNSMDELSKTIQRWLIQITYVLGFSLVALPSALIFLQILLTLLNK